MKFKYLYITGIVATLNIFNTNMALADMTSGIDVLLPITYSFIFFIVIGVIMIRTGINGLKYIKHQKSQVNQPDNE